MSHKQKTRWWSWVVVWAVLFAAYLLYASTLTPVELIAGLVASAVATIAAVVFGAVGIVRFRPSPRDLLEGWRVPAEVVLDTAKVMRALWLELFTSRGAGGGVYAIEYGEVGDEPRSTARRALLTIFATKTPNTIVLGVVRRQRLLLYHQIVPARLSKVFTNLGASA